MIENKLCFETPPFDFVPPILKFIDWAVSFDCIEKVLSNLISMLSFNNSIVVQPVVIV